MGSARELLRLADACEKAVGASRELDAEIWDAAVRGPAVEGRLRWHAQNAPPYTSSLDAALTLVPEGSYWEAGTFSDRDGDIQPGYWVDIRTPDWERGECRHADTPALALCAAALRSMSASMGKKT